MVWVWEIDLHADPVALEDIDGDEQVVELEDVGTAAPLPEGRVSAPVAVAGLEQQLAEECGEHSAFPSAVVVGGC